MSVLYDEPGPRARQRIRIASAISLVVIVTLIVLALRRFQTAGQFDARFWRDLGEWPVQRFLLLGLVTTLKLGAIAVALSFTIGLVLAMGRLAKPRWIRYPVTAYVHLSRAIPLLILILFSALALPRFGIDVSLQAYLVIGLTVYNSSVIAEIVRAGVLTLDRGQREAALSVGLTEGLAMRLVVLPQALRRMLPALLSQVITVIKDTSLGFVIGVEELLRRGQLTAEFYNTLLAASLVTALIYLVVLLTLSRVVYRVDRRFGVAGAGHTAVLDALAAEALTTRRS